MLDSYALSAIAPKIVFTRAIDSYFGYSLGHLAYRSLRFESETLETANYQGCAVMNYTDTETPYTRIIEHKHFAFGTQPKTVVTRECPVEWMLGAEPYDLAPRNRASYNVRKKGKKTNKGAERRWQERTTQRADYCQAAGGRTALQPGQDDL